MTIGDILDFLWTVAPEEGKEDWDNVGLLVGRRSTPVDKVLVTLDITPPVMQEAADMGAQLIVSHHPLIWDTYKFVNDSVFQQEKVLSLAEHKIGAICMHTNLDEAEDGVDDTLVEALGLTSVGRLAEGRIGHICELEQEMPLQAFLALVKEKLGANGLRYCDGGRPVRRVATGCGSCGEYLPEAIQAGCDTFVTGDVKHNIFLDGQGQGVSIIDAGHFSTENPIVAKLQRKLAVRFPALEVQIAKSNVQPERFF